MTPQRLPGHITKQEAADETTAYINAIMDAIHDVAMTRRAVGLNLHLPCILSALAGCVGHHVAGVEASRREALAKDVITTILECIDKAAATEGAAAVVFDNSDAGKGSVQ